MSLFANLFRSSIGRKFLMAVTGLVLTGFVTGHMIGNYHIFAGPDELNGYAHFLQSLGPVLWLLRLFLLACVGIHIWAALTLTLESKAARGSEQYGVSKWLRAAWASRYMRMTGVVVLAFIIYHILHFTVGLAGSGYYKGVLPEYTLTKDFHLTAFKLVDGGTTVHDVYSMVFIGFSKPIVAIFYMVATTLLSIHLLHGVDSMFQTIGWRNKKWSACLGKLVTLFALVYCLGNLILPGAILTGAVKPEEGTTAYKVLVEKTPLSEVVQTASGEVSHVTAHN